MKKIITVIILISFSILSTIVILSKYKKNAIMTSIKRTIEEAEKINVDSFLGLQYLEFAGFSEEEAKEYNDDHPGTKRTNDGYVYGYFYKMPVDSVDRRLTQIIITGGDYHVFGIHVEDKFDQAMTILKQRGYKKFKTQINRFGDGMVEVRFKKEFVIILLTVEPESQIIKEIAILTRAR